MASLSYIIQSFHQDTRLSFVAQHISPFLHGYHTKSSSKIPYYQTTQVNSFPKYTPSLDSKLVETGLELGKEIMQSIKPPDKPLPLGILCARTSVLRGCTRIAPAQNDRAVTSKRGCKNCPTYAILAHTEHFHCPSAPTARHVLQTRSLQVWHSSPLSKMKPRLFWQRTQILLLSCREWRFPPFLLTSRSSFFNFLEVKK